MRNFFIQLSKEKLQKWSKGKIYKATNKCMVLGMQPKVFQCGGGFVELKRFDKSFVKSALVTLKTTFWMVDLTQWWTQINHLLANLLFWGVAIASQTAKMKSFEMILTFKR